MKKTLLIFTDTTSEQVNGVNRSIENLRKNIHNHEIVMISADDFFSVPFFWYKEIRLSFSFPNLILKKIQTIRPDYIHIATEWPIGLAAATVCKKYKIPYTTSFHTKFPEYLNMRNALIKEKYVHFYLHYIHDSAKKIFISNNGMIPYIKRHKYGKYAVIPLGIDHDIFHAGEKNLFQNEKRKKLLFVGRIAIEKNIEKFLQISEKYAKIIVGDGPERARLEKKYPHALFLGVKKWKDLADIYRSVDAFIFPSKTDTLGLVNLEAMACGKPVVAYDIENMRGIVQNGKSGILVATNKPLESGVNRAFGISAEYCSASVQHFSWENYAQKFIENQVQIDKNIYGIL